MSYFITNSGRRISINNISADDICLHDIAHSLTKTCRYGGALPLNVHYSVAQHSIQLANYARLEGFDYHIQRIALLHDASEAYLGDVISSVKKQLPDYQKIEENLDYLILKKYLYTYDVALSFNEHINLHAINLIKRFDTQIILDEAAAFFPDRYNDFSSQLRGLEPLGIDLYPETNLEETYYLFLWWCEKLGIKD